MNKKFKNKDNTIHGISLPLKGWGYYKYRNVQGKEETLIVKKNPFNTYSVIDKNGNVIKITDLQQYLQTLGIVLITGYSELGEMSNKTAKLTGNMIQNLDERHLNDVLEKSELNAKNVQHSKTIQDLEERGRQQDDRLDELYGERFERRDYFNKYLNDIAKMKYKRSGWEVVYTPANNLQRSIGVTTGYHREHRTSQSDMNIGMSSYLVYLKASLPEDIAPQLEPLIAECDLLEEKIKNLSKNNTVDEFAKTAFLFRGFVDNFTASMIQLKQMYPNSDVNYYSYSSNYDRSDEEYEEEFSVDNMIANGLEVSRKLVTEFYGKDKAEQIFANINEEKQQTL